VFAYILADRYVKPIHAVAMRRRILPPRGLEPVPEAHRRDEIGLLTRSLMTWWAVARARERESRSSPLETFHRARPACGRTRARDQESTEFHQLALDQLRAALCAAAARIGTLFLRQLVIMKVNCADCRNWCRVSALRPADSRFNHVAGRRASAEFDGVVALSQSKMRARVSNWFEEEGTCRGPQRGGEKPAHLLHPRGGQRDQSDADGRNYCGSVRERQNPGRL